MKFWLATGPHASASEPGFDDKPAAAATKPTACGSMRKLGRMLQRRAEIEQQMWRIAYFHHVTGGELEEHKGVLPIHALVVGVTSQVGACRRPCLGWHLAEKLRRRACTQNAAHTRESHLPGYLLLCCLDDLSV